MLKLNSQNAHLVRDALIIIVSILLAYFLVKIDAFRTILNSTGEIKFLSSFFAGIFFTSIFTTPVAMVTLGEIALASPVFHVAFWGACGAILGDLAIYFFVKDNISKDIQYILSRVRTHKRLLYIFKLKVFRWLTPFLGALVIASPLPDELGIAMMGLSKMKLSLMIPISFTMNFLGIVLIGLIANAA